jgi:hypothetical protein
MMPLLACDETAGMAAVVVVVVLLAVEAERRVRVRGKIPRAAQE